MTDTQAARESDVQSVTSTYRVPLSELIRLLGIHEPEGSSRNAKLEGGILEVTVTTYRFAA